MKNTLILFSHMGAMCLQAAAFLFFVFRLLPAKKPGRKGIIISLAGIAGITAALSAANLSGFYRMSAEAVWLAFCSRRFQRAEARISLFLGIFYQLAASFWQFLIAAWLGVLFHSPAFLVPDTAIGQIAIWLFPVLSVAAALYLWKHPNMAGKEAFRFASTLAVAGFIAVITLSEQTVLTIPDDILDMWTILAVVLMTSVLVFNINRQYQVEKELAELKTQQAQLLERDYTALNHAYAANARLFHDFHNHLGVLRQFLSHERYGEALQYLDELHAPVREMRDAVWTGDETVDYLINEKTARAKAGGIDLKVQVEFPRRTNLGSADLCAILGNLLDNALEAAGQVSEPESRFIRLTIRRIHQMLVIKLENSFAGRPVMEDGMPKTTKENNGLHGWGLKSVQTAAEKYDGMVQTSYTDGLFRTVVTLSYEGISAEGQV